MLGYIFDNYFFLFLLNETVRQALAAGHLAHLVTLNKDGSPQVSIVWLALMAMKLSLLT